MHHNKEDLYYKAWRHLPERFRKENNLKLYYVLYGGYGEIESGFKTIKDSRDIDKAMGETLDKIGSNVGQIRLGEDDELYRQLIKVRIISNLSIGDIPTINEVLSILVKDIYLGIKEAWQYEDYEHEPAAFVVTLPHTIKAFPYDVVDRIKAAGVRILFEINYKDKLILTEDTNAFTSPFYPVGKIHKCGTIFKHQYTGKKVNSNIKIPNGTAVRSQRTWSVNEPKTGHTRGGKR